MPPPWHCDNCSLFPPSNGEASNRKFSRISRFKQPVQGCRWGRRSPRRRARYRGCARPSRPLRGVVAESRSQAGRGQPKAPSCRRARPRGHLLRLVTSCGASQAAAREFGIRHRFAQANCRIATRQPPDAGAAAPAQGRQRHGPSSAPSRGANRARWGPQPRLNQ